MACEACSNDSDSLTWCTEQIKWICAECYTTKHGGPPPVVDDNVPRPKIIRDLTEIPSLHSDHAVHSVLMSIEHIFRFNAEDIAVNLKKLDLHILLTVRSFMCEKLQGMVEKVKDVVPCQRRAVNTAVNDIIVLGHCISNASLVKGIGAIFSGCEPEITEVTPDLADILTQFQALKTEFSEKLESLHTRVATLESENAALKSRLGDISDDAPLIQSENPSGNTTFRCNIDRPPSEETDTNSDEFSEEYLDHSRQRRSARPPAGSKTPQPAARTTPVSYKTLFIGNVNKACTLKDIVHHIKSMDVIPGKVSCISRHESNHKSFKVEIPADSFAIVLAQDNWANGIKVRPFRENPAQAGVKPASAGQRRQQQYRPRPHNQSNGRSSQGPGHSQPRQRTQQQNHWQYQQPPVVVYQPPAWNGWPPLSGGSRAPQWYPGQHYPGQQHPGQQHPGQQHPGQHYPGQQLPGQQFPGAGLF